MKSLRIQVERVVRPIVASPARKDRMREELLAHLTQMFEEEKARSGDDSRATAVAIKRFGEPGALTSELQDSVPWLERSAYFSLPQTGLLRRRTDETPLKHVFRLICWQMAFCAIGMIVPATIGLIAINHRPHRTDELTAGQFLIVILATMVIQGVTMVAGSLLSEGMRRELDKLSGDSSSQSKRRAIRRIVSYAAVGAMLFGAAVGGFFLVINAFLPYPLIPPSLLIGIIGGVMAISGPLMLKHAWDWNASTRRFDRWESLELDEQPAP